MLEIKKWDQRVSAWFVIPNEPWLIRGSNALHGADIGAFAFAYRYGSAYNEGSFRVVLKLL